MEKPEYMFAYSSLGKFMAKWSKRHFDLAVSVLLMMHQGREFGVMYSSEDPPGVNILYAFADASFGLVIRGGRVLYLNRGPISWRAKKQTIIQLSTAAAEMTEASLCSLDVVAIRNLLSEIGLFQEQATIIFQDNTAAIDISNHEGSLNLRTKHLSLRILKIRELVKEKLFCSSIVVLSGW